MKWHWIQTKVTEEINLLTLTTIQMSGIFLIMVINTHDSRESNHSDLRSRKCLDLLLIYLMDVKIGTETIRR